jgi:hypothetical protein
MAIIYTYPLLTSIQGDDLFLVSDTSNNNATRSITAADFGAYIQATYGPGTNIYQADGSITGNRQLSGASLYSLTLASLTSFNVQSPSLFTSTVQLDSTITIPTGASNGYVLTSDGAGVATWQAVPDSTILTVNGTANRISVTGSSGPNPVVDIDSAYVGQTSITTLGTITTGTWNGATIAIANGGTGASTAQDGINELTQSVGAITGDVLTRDPLGNAVWEATAPAVNIYTTDGTVSAGRVATLADDLTWTGGRIKRVANSVNIVEITKESDFGTVVAGAINLASDTTYVVRGNVTCSNTLNVNGANSAIIGLNRNLDKLIYTGTGEFIVVNNYDFTIKDVWLSSTTTGSLLISGTNVTGSGFNLGRTKVLELVNCQIRNCYDVMNIAGFDLVDISNTLFFYVEAPGIGCRFKDTSKIEFSSCEFIRWYAESNNTLPAYNAGTTYAINDTVSFNGSFYISLQNSNTGNAPDASPAFWAPYRYATTPMIELAANNLASFGAVNINGCIMHPQQTQNGVDINSGSTTGFGTISSNAFVNLGLTTGVVFAPVNGGLPDYSQTATYNYDVFANQGATYNYDVFANQGVLNSTSGSVSTLNNNTLATTGAPTATPSSIAIGGATPVQTQSAVRYSTVATTGVTTYDGTKQKFASIHASITVNNNGNSDTWTVSLHKNGTLLPGSEQQIELTAGGGSALETGVVSINYGTLFSNGDNIEMKIGSVGSSSCIIVDYQLVVRE